MQSIDKNAMTQASSTRPFQKRGSGRAYKQRRYGSALQKRVDRREQTLAERLLRAQQVQAGGLVIDVPCGYGRFHALLKRLEFRVLAMDQSQAMVTLCHQHADFDADDQALRADVLERLPAQADAADVALSVRLFQHLHEPDLRIRALRVLGANARPIVMTYYDSGCLHYFSKRLLMWLKRKPVRIKMIPRRQFEAEVAEAGLRIAKRIKLIPGIHAQTWVLLTAA